MATWLHAFLWSHLISFFASLFSACLLQGHSSFWSILIIQDNLFKIVNLNPSVKTLSFPNKLLFIILVCIFCSFILWLISVICRLITPTYKSPAVTSSVTFRISFQIFGWYLHLWSSQVSQGKNKQTSKLKPTI